MPKSKNIFGDNPKLSFFLGLFIGVAVFSTITALVLVVAMFSNGSLSLAFADSDKEAADQPAEEAAAQPTQELAEVPPIDANDNVYGPEDAGVEMIVYSDFECPYCLNYSDTVNQIKDTYGEEVRIAFRHFPLSFHANAKGAALASECAGEQDDFWAMHDLIFEASAEKNMSLETWKEAAEELGLDTEQFNECLDSEKYASKIASQMESAVKSGVRGTPATFINGKMVSGALPFSSFKQIIDSELQ